MMTKFKPWLILSVIFFAGLLSGVGLSIGLASHFMHPPKPEDMKRHIMNRLVRELQLNDDQRQKIQPIVEKTIDQVEAVHVDEASRVSDIIKASNLEIAPLLTPDQMTRLDQLEAKREKMMSGHMMMWGFPHDRHGPDGPPADDHAAPPPPAPTK